MPVQVSYPGVYVEEISSGVRTITGVATSITAFIGKATRGPVDEATTITSWSDYERIFGGLSLTSNMSYAVRDFFANGGALAVIVRLFKDPGATADRSATLLLKDLHLVASSPGAWGNTLRVRVDQRPTNDPNLIAVAQRLGVQPADIFDITVRDSTSRVIERFLNLTTKESARRVDRVLAAESQLVRVADGVALPSDTEPTMHDGSLSDADVWTADNKSTKSGPLVAGDTVKAAGDSAALDQAAYTGSLAAKTGLFALEQADLFNLLCIAADDRGGVVPAAVYQAALSYCQTRRAVLLVDPDPAWKGTTDAIGGVASLGLNGEAARNAAVYYPRLLASDPLLGGQIESFAPSGMVAGVLARTDTTRGVWKAPAGTDASLNGTAGLTVGLTDLQCGLLNQQGVNCLRSFAVFGRVVWGARTLRGADAAADEYKYVPVRRTALYIEESLYRGLKRVVFEPNDEPLWAQIRLNVGAFMHNLFRQGAFQGQTPQEANFVRCDKDTTTQNDINLGIVNIVVGFAPLKPAEFVIIQIQQIAGQIVT